MHGKRILTIDPQGTTTVLDVPPDQDLLPVLYHLIRCTTVDAVNLTDQLTMWLDDEGMIKPNPIPNIPATLLAHTFGTSQAFFGTAVFTGGPDHDGDTQGLTTSQVADLETTLEKHVTPT